jgi:hypothetical protein
MSRQFPKLLLKIVVTVHCSHHCNEPDGTVMEPPVMIGLDLSVANVMHRVPSECVVNLEVRPVLIATRLWSLLFSYTTGG